MEKFVITCNLARIEDGKPVVEKGSPVYEKNYFCGFHPSPIRSHNIQLVEWDTDHNYAKVFFSRYEAKQMSMRIRMEENLKIEKFIF